MSNFASPPAEPGVYLFVIKIERGSVAKLAMLPIIVVAIFISFLGSPLGLAAFLLKLVVAGLLPGYLIVSLIRGKDQTHLSLGVSVFIGLAITINIYAILRAFGLIEYFNILLCLSAMAGGWKLFAACRKNSDLCLSASNIDYKAIYSGLFIMLFIGSAFYSSGNAGDGSFAFYGPMSRDHIYHLAQISRFAFHVPADNFVISGYPSCGYHFFSDLLQYLLANELFLPISEQDVYFKYYPALIFFGIGFYSYKLLTNIFEKPYIAVLGVVVVVLGADLSWLPDGVKFCINIIRSNDFSTLFMPWIGRHPFGVMYPLVHRPAHYHGLLFVVMGLSVLSGSIKPIQNSADFNKRWIIVYGHF